MESSQTFKNKVAIVTGGGSGIGQTCARLLLERGAKVVIAGRDEKVNETASQFNPKGERVLPVQLDLSEEVEVRKMVKDVIKKFGQIDILINSAGVTRPG